MMVFVDTNVLFGSVSRADRYHADSVRILDSIESAVTTDLVLSEAWALVRGRIGRHAAMRFWSGLRHAPITVRCVEPLDLERALSIAEAWPDQDFDLVDRSSFAFMERLGIERVASFDSNFAVYRTGPDRKRAFEIVR